MRRTRVAVPDRNLYIVPLSLVHFLAEVERDVSARLQVSVEVYILLWCCVVEQGVGVESRWIQLQDDRNHPFGGSMNFQTHCADLP